MLSIDTHGWLELRVIGVLVIQWTRWTVENDYL